MNYATCSCKAEHFSKHTLVNHSLNIVFCLPLGDSSTEVLMDRWVCLSQYLAWRSNPQINSFIKNQILPKPSVAPDYCLTPTEFFFLVAILPNERILFNVRSLGIINRIAILENIVSGIIVAVCLVVYQL